MGAKEIKLRSELDLAKIRPLDKATWQGAVDNLGGEVLAWMASTMMQGGTIASIGLAASMSLNTTVAPFDKPQVREAFNLAVDRAKVVQAAYFGHAVPGGPLSPALTEWATPVSQFSCYTPDANKAKALLKEAGFSGDVPVTLKVLGSIQTVRDVAQVVQAQLNAAGFKATLVVPLLIGCSVALPRDAGPQDFPTWV